MVKLFFVGTGVFVLAVVGAFAAVFTPLLAGVNRNLGGPPQSPFHSPIPQPWVNAAHGWLAQLTPSVWLVVALALVALLLVYTLGDLVAHLAKQWTEQRKRHAELRWRERVMAAREQARTPDANTAADVALWT